MYEQKNDDSKGLWIPREYEDDENLSPIEMLILSSIKNFCNIGVCYATNDYFSKKFHVGTATVTRAISKLEKDGYISVSIDNGRNRIAKLLDNPNQNDEGYNQIDEGVNQNDLLINNKENKTINKSIQNDSVTKSHESADDVMDFSSHETYLREVLPKQIGKMLEENDYYINHVFVSGFHYCLSEILRNRHAIYGLDMFRVNKEKLKEMFDGYIESLKYCGIRINTTNDIDEDFKDTLAQCVDRFMDRKTDNGKYLPNLFFTVKFFGFLYLDVQGCVTQEDADMLVSNF